MLLTGAPACEVDVVRPGRYGGHAPWGGVDLAPVEGDAGAVDVESSEDLADRPVETKDDLVTS